MLTMYLTKRQKQVLDYIRDYVADAGYAPTLEEIGANFGLSSPATVYKHVNRLVQKGYLQKAPHQGRGLRLVDTESHPTAAVPILGQLVAGQPIKALPRPQNTRLPSDLVGDRPTFALQAHGDSLASELIRHGDIIVIEDRCLAEDGEIVIGSLRGEEIVLKRFAREGDQIRLQATHGPPHPLLVMPASFHIRGIVVGVLRRYT